MFVAGWGLPLGLVEKLDTIGRYATDNARLRRFYEPPPRWLVSCRVCRRWPPASVPTGAEPNRLPYAPERNAPTEPATSAGNCCRPGLSGTADLAPQIAFYASPSRETLPRSGYDERHSLH